MGRKKRESTDTSKAFADRLSDLVEEKKSQGYSHNEICAALNIGSGTLSGWLSDDSDATIDNLQKVAKFFDVSTDYLLGLSSTRSRNADMQIVCNYTGLSEGTISYLSTLDPAYSSHICRIFTESYPSKMYSDRLLVELSLFEELIKIFESSFENLQYSCSLDSLHPCDAEQQLSAMNSLKSHIDAQRFHAIDAYSQILDQLFRYSYLQENYTMLANKFRSLCDLKTIENPSLSEIDSIDLHTRTVSD